MGGCCLPEIYRVRDLCLQGYLACKMRSQMQVTSGALQVQAVAWEVKKQVAQYIFVDAGSIKSLITLLAASEQAPERRVAVDMLHVTPKP